MQKNHTISLSLVGFSVVFLFGIFFVFLPTSVAEASTVYEQPYTTNEWTAQTVGVGCVQSSTCEFFLLGFPTTTINFTSTFTMETVVKVESWSGNNPINFTVIQPYGLGVVCGSSAAVNVGTYPQLNNKWGILKLTCSSFANSVTASSSPAGVALSMNSGSVNFTNLKYMGNALGIPYVRICDANGCNSNTINFEELLISGALNATSGAAWALATSSGLFNLNSASSSCGTSSGFLDVGYAMCAVGVYLFVPNSATFENFTNLSNAATERFPFSWVNQISETFESLSASSSSNFINLQINLHDLGIGTTSAMGNFLPNITILSTSTIYTYITPTQWSWFQSLIAIGIWLTFLTDVFYTARNQMHKV